MKTIEAFLVVQKKVCLRQGSPFVACLDHVKIGVAENALEGILPLNGLRHPPTDTTCGWYIWGGVEFSGADDFFKPLHVHHLPDLMPGVIKYLGLAPGWRFLVHGEYEDLWFDTSLLNA